MPGAASWRRQRCDHCDELAVQLLDAREVSPRRTIRFVCHWCYDELAAAPAVEPSQLALPI